MPSSPAPVDPTNLNLLAQVGEAVYGAYWQKPMAEHFGISQRQMVRWANQQWSVPDTLPDGRHLVVVLKDLLDEHQRAVDAARLRVLSALPEGGRPGT